MSLAERIIQHVKSLPESFQAEVLDFVEYLETKVGKQKDSEEADWAALSITNAMRGMEEEDSPYSLDDLQERFS